MSAPFHFQAHAISRRLLARSAEPGCDGWTAAVLLAILDVPDCPSLLFTRRAEHLKHHAGQISFPGGRREPTDAMPSLTALRESWEEVGIAPSRVQVLGSLGSYRTNTGFVVVPVVAVVAAHTALRIDPHEVLDTFTVPLSWLYGSTGMRTGHIHRNNKAIPYYSLRYRNYLIWGASAAILRRFLAVLRSNGE